MRIGELSVRTGVPVATIKYYVREGILAGGERTGYNQVSYGEEHVRRLRLVRALVETGSLPIAKVREILDKASDPERDVDSALGVVSRAMDKTREVAEPARDDLAEAYAIAERHGWKRALPQRERVKVLADVIGTLRLLGMDELIERADDYARAAQMVAETDIEMLSAQSDRDEILESMIIGTVLGDAFFSAMRRLAHIEVSGRRFKAPREARDDTDRE
ncbi:MerR family transcriptional regulator [Glycomyces tenuis]|uniref:MerR family transcriptional regulator n=1 Tax=Glycomyces tenuis TaxID=58116 RepID=UPI0004058169|nr:MerR family transcriptional regulator [Glycomyces tenuis]